MANEYPEIKKISIDFALLEHAQNVVVAAGDFSWDDLGSWTALHEHHTTKAPRADSNLIASDGIFTLHAEGNYVHSPKKFVAVVGVKDLVIVETPDALLITTRERSQDVGKIVKYLDEKKLHKLV